MTQAIQYVCGILFSQDRRRLALIRKNRGPANMAGRLNGLGGKVEPGETLPQAMAREFEEESGVHIDTWIPVGVLRLPAACVTFFAAFSDRLHDVRSTTDEDVITTYVDHALTDGDLMPGLPVVILVALNQVGAEFTNFHAPDFANPEPTP